MKAEEFKVRASCAGKLMTDPKNKNDKLSETTQSFLEEWAKEQIYGTKKEFSSRQTKKGIEVEQEAIDLAIDWADLEFCVKNETSFEDEYFTGTPDIITSDMVVDMKSSWDCFTFPLFETEIPTKDYFYQLQVYMYLTGKRKAKLIYTLLNTPDHLDHGDGIDYSPFEPEKRCRVFDVEYDQAVIDKLIDRVKESRNYLKTIMEWHH
jgi:hypothetical protein